MLLYTVTYPGNSCDFDIPLESAAKIPGARAECTNGPKQVYVFRGGDWREVDDRHDSLHAVGCQCGPCSTTRIADEWDPRMGPK